MKSDKLKLIVDRLDKQGYELLNNEYKGANINYEIKCKICGLEFRNHYSRIMHNDNPIRCPHCDRDKPNSVKWYLELVQNYCQLFDVEFLSKEYKISRDNYWFKCSCGNKFQRTWNSFYVKDSHQCPECSGFTKWDINKIKELMQQYNLKLISKEYKNYHKQKLKIQCTCGDIYEQSLSQFLNTENKCCGKCMGSIEWNLETVTKKAAELGLEVLSKEYKNTLTDMVFKCGCGNIINRRWASVIYSGAHTCSECQGRTMWDIDKCHEYMKNNTTATMLSTEYKGATERYDFICECGEHFTRVWRLIVENHSYYCDICVNRLSVGERIIRKFLKDNNIKYIREYTIDDMRSSNAGGMLRFDFYLPEYNIAIEFDGEQHYRPVQFGGMSLERAEEEFIKTQERDKSKNQYCKDNNILLHRIP